jgi:prevent-host-death family protein
MTRVGVAELRKHLPEWLDKVAAGDEVLVVRRGRPLVRLTAAEDAVAAARRSLAGIRGTAKVGDVETPLEVDWEAQHGRA